MANKHSDLYGPMYASDFGTRRIRDGLNDVCDSNIHIVTLENLAYLITVPHFNDCVWDVTIPDDAVVTVETTPFARIVADKYIATNKRMRNILSDDTKNHVFNTIKSNPTYFADKITSVSSVLSDEHMKWLYMNIANDISPHILFAYKNMFTPEETRSMIDRIVTTTNATRLYIPFEFRKQWHYDMMFANGMHISRIPASFVTKEMIIWAVNNDEGSIDHIPNKFKKDNLMDLVNDIPLALKHLRDREFTQEFYLKCFEKDYRCISYIPAKYTTENMWERVLLKKRSSPQCYTKYCPKEYCTKEFCAKILKKNIDAVCLFPDECIPEEFIDAIIQDTMMLDRYIHSISHIVSTSRLCDILCKNEKYIPWVAANSLTQQLCIDVFNANKNASVYIPCTFMTEPMWIELMNHHLHECYTKIANYMPSQYFTQDVANYVYSVSPYVVQRIPDELKTQEMATHIITNYPWNIKYLPYKFVTQEICDKVALTTWNTLKGIPEKYRNIEMYMKLLDESPSSFASYPKNIHTEEMCKKAVDMCVYNIKYISDEFKTLDMYENLRGVPYKPCEVPDHIYSEKLAGIIGKHLIDVPSDIKYGGRFVTYDICMTACKKHVYDAYVRDLVSDIPPDFRTTELYETALNNNSVLFKKIPVDKRSNKIYEIICMRHPKYIRKTPSEYITSEIIDNALKKNPLNIKYIPHHMKTAEMCEHVAGKKIKTIQYIPDQFKTQEMCDKAYKQSIRFITHIPQHLRTSEMDTGHVKN